MKYLTTAILGILLFGSLKAQSNLIALNDSLVARFNRGDYEGFYELGSASWKKHNAPNGIIGWLNYMKDQTGLITSTVLTTDSGDAKYFTWDGQKKMISFQLKSSADNTFDGFDFKTYHVPLSELNNKKIPTDNPLKTPADSAVNAVTTDFMITHKLIGLSIGIVKDGKRYSYNYGTVEKGRARLPTAHTTFELASVSKTFTGILLAWAVLDKRLSLTDDTRKYMDGEFPNLQYQGKPIRIIDLSNHTSGLPAELPNLDQYTSSFDVLKMYDQYTNEKFFADLRQVKLDTFPGTTYGYSNSGVKLMGIILEKIYGQRYQELLKKYITGPMHMKDTKIALAVSDTTSYTKGYDGLGNLMPHLNFNMFGGAGSILSTADDMMSYVQENITEKIPAVRLSHQQTFVNPDITMGICWLITRHTTNGTRIWKSGGALGFRSYCAVIPERNIGIIRLSNRSDLMEDELSEMVDKLLHDVLYH